MNIPKVGQRWIGPGKGTYVMVREITKVEQSGSQFNPFHNLVITYRSRNRLGHAKTYRVGGRTWKTWQNKAKLMEESK